MAKNRYINTKFWDDNYISYLDPIEKLMFLYFLTNPLTDICGIYEIPVRRIAFDTGIDKEMIIKIIDRFTNDNKIFYVDGWIYIKNFSKHQANNPSVEKGIKRSMDLVPQDIISKIKGIDEVDDSLSEGVADCDLPKLKPKLKPKPKPKYIAITDCEEFSSESYINQLVNDKQKHISLIGKYFKTRKIKFPSKKAAQDEIKRWVKDARTLIEYPEEQINRTFAYVSEKFPEEWNLSTIRKYITNN